MLSHAAQPRDCPRLYTLGPRERYIERVPSWLGCGPRAGVGFRAPGVRVGVGVDNDRGTSTTTKHGNRDQAARRRIVGGRLLRTSISPPSHVFDLDMYSSSLARAFRGQGRFP